ncbi:hypothetical protein AVEN_77483-1 [Araneus ventricosus]|uniref:Uncharacterized protein n=1 Tax=Araneus ventricosus TaxID=182803 RepID=A0A4Y2NFH3_ARAVE|nr:hypothetical protein AVEN_77483-1 [Araneus ventricosus]
MNVSEGFDTYLWSLKSARLWLKDHGKELDNDIGSLWKNTGRGSREPSLCLVEASGWKVIAECAGFQTMLWSLSQREIVSWSRSWGRRYQMISVV